MGAHPDFVREVETPRSVAFFCKKRPILVGPELIKDLKKIAIERQGKNVRICLHDGPEAIQHDMIILEHRGVYIRPHKHPEKEDVYHIMEGQMAVYLFENNGSVISVEILYPGNIYRIGLDMYHAVTPLTSRVIYHESKPGPFLGEGDAIYPGWAPDGSDAKVAADYSRYLFSHLPEDQFNMDEDTGTAW